MNAEESNRHKIKKPVSKKPVPRKKYKSWKEKPSRTKYDHIEIICDTLRDLPMDLILASVIRLLKESSKQKYTDLGIVLNYATASPDNSRKLLSKLNDKVPRVNPITPFQGLSLLLDANLSKRQYLKIREVSGLSGVTIFPLYDNVRTSKQECRPPIQDATITETSASYTLESLVKYTTSRIIDMQADVIIQNQNIKQIKKEECVITFSCGCDGSSGQSSYKQKYAENDNAGANDDSSLFATTMIPLRLNNVANDIYWNNKTPQSVRFCRPIKIQYAKETRQLILDEKKSLDDQIKLLKPRTFHLKDGHSVKVKFVFYLSCIDGKVLSTFTDTKSTQSCPICKSTPNDFNVKENLGSLKFKPKEGSLLFGISPLHCYIRAMEWMLHLSYKMETKRWQARSKEDKDNIKSRKAEVQKLLWTEMSLRVDFPNSSGSGTSNDGNTARRAFHDFRSFARILNVNVEIVEKLRNILLALNSQLPINPEKFKAYCDQLYFSYLELYAWYKLPASIHKILAHGCEIIKASSLPLGMLGEEGAESRNKLYKSDRNCHARKSSRLNTMHDVFFRAIDSSDPILSSQSLTARINSKSKRESLPFDVAQLLEVPTVNYCIPSYDDNNTDIDNIDSTVAEILDDIVLDNEDDDLV